MTDLLSFILGALALLINIFALYLVISRRKLPISYSVGVIGYPKSGKTFLITAIFGELFNRRYKGYTIIPRGKETIERINKNLSCLDTGQPIGPTQDQDVFAYRADLTKGVFPIDRNYKIQIGDFPGEKSEEFALQFGDWFHDTSYFKWVMEADAFIFVIDLTPIIAERDHNEYVALMTKAIRASWHHLLEYHFEGKKTINKKPVMLVFTKADLLLDYGDFVYDKSSLDDVTRNNIYTKGLVKYKPRYIAKANYDLNKMVTSRIEYLFSDLINYLESQSNTFTIRFISSITRTGEEQYRLGINDIIEKILP